MRIFLRILLSVSFSAFALSASYSVTVSPVMEYDIKTNGFIGDTIFQTTVTSQPSSDCYGLVARRESAVIRARNDVQKKTIDALVDFRIDIAVTAGATIEPSLIPNIREYLHDKFLPIVVKGIIMEEYYGKNDEATIVFRIEKSGLKKTISSISIPEKLLSNPGVAQ